MNIFADSVDYLLLLAFSVQMFYIFMYLIFSFMIGLMACFNMFRISALLNLHSYLILVL